MGRDRPDEGGDPACWAGLICADCGIVLDGSPHRDSCSESPPSAGSGTQPGAESGTPPAR